MIKTGLLCIAEGILCDADGNWLPDVFTALERFRLRDVPVAALALSAATTVSAHPALSGTWRPTTDKELPPRPHVLFRVLREAQLHGPKSWLIGTHPDHAIAAGQAGLMGCVLIGDAALPTDDLGIICAKADNLADAPRVMIPRGGGCWH